MTADVDERRDVPERPDDPGCRDDPGRLDDRPLHRRLLAPAAVALATVAGLAYLFAVDPNEPGHYPLCPTQALLGVDCPGCGLTRATYALLHGDVPTALDHNLLVIPFWTAAIVAWALWLLHAIRGSTPARSAQASALQSRLALLALVLIVAFGVVRNFVPYLGSGAAG